MQQPWAITEQALETLVEMARLNLSGLSSAWGDELAEPEPKAKPEGGVGVIPIRGTIKQHSSSSFFDFLFGGTSTDGLSQQMRAFLADESVRAIVLDIDSPGGSTYGMTELANEIMAARGKKPIVAIANSVAASAAYWIGAAADQFYVTPGGLVGSIGVYMVHEDVSQMAEDLGLKVTFVSAGKHKLRGNQFEPLSEEDESHYQALVNDSYDMFVKDVARGRGVTPAAVRSGFGEGDVVTATSAKKLGMVDGVMTLDAVIAKAQTLRPKSVRGTDGAAAEAGDPEIEATHERLREWRAQQWKAQNALASAITGGPSGNSG